MVFARLRTWLLARTGWERIALIVWSALLAFVSVRVCISPTTKTVYPIFSASGRFWWTGTDLYEPYRPTNVQDGYRYSPTCAILFTPFALFPDVIGGVLWRLCSAAALLGSLAWFARSLVPRPRTSKQFAWLLLFVIPLSLQSVNNGQANIAVVACLVGAIASVREARWNLASVLLALAFVCKLYPLALGLMLILLYPRQLAWRVPAACLASLLFPFLCQSPAYVVDQYAKWFHLLHADEASHHMYRDLWLLIDLYGITMSQKTYLLLQAASGIGIALWCWQRQRAGWPQPVLLTSTLALTMAWTMLLGPATESSSFALLAPSLAWSVVAALQTQERNARHGLLWAGCVLFAIAVVLGGLNKDWNIHELGFHAWGSLCYFAYALSEPRPEIVRGVSFAASRPSAATR